jgi:hypothetical protein
VLAGAAAAAPSWTGPVELSPAGRVVGPELALNGVGDAVVVWNREEGEVCPEAPDNPACVHVVEAISRAPEASSWQSPVELARPGVGSGPRVALDPIGNAVVAWSHDIGEPRILQASYRRGRSGPWDNPIDVSDERFRAGTQQVGVDSAGNVFVAWARSGTEGLVVQAAVRPVESGVWGPPVDVSVAGAVGAPSLAVGPGGQAVLAWVLSTGVVQATVWTGVWQAPVDLGSGAASDVAVAVSASGDAAAAWSSRRDASVIVQAAFRSRGSGWTPAGDVAATGRSESAAPQVAIDVAGNAHAVWVGSAGRALVQGSTRSRASSAWSPPVEISPPDRDASDPRLALDAAGNAVAVWTEAEGVTRAAIRPAAGPWQPAVDLSPPNSPTRNVRVAIGRVGAAFAVWSRFEPRRVRVEASDLAGGGPVLSSFTVPATGRAGSTVEFGVRPLSWAAALFGEPNWSFGDGAIAAGATVRHAFARPGRYTVSVTQGDAAGGTSTSSGAITIVAAAPANTVRPVIRGRPRAGATLTCNRGAWTGTPPIRFAYRWLRNARSIPGGRARRYGVALRDRGTRLVCKVTATNVGGSRSVVSRPVRILR